MYTWGRVLRIHKTMLEKRAHIKRRAKWYVGIGEMQKDRNELFKACIPGPARDAN